MSLLSNIWFQQGGFITRQFRLCFQSNFKQGTYIYAYIVHVLISYYNHDNVEPYWIWFFFLSQWQTFCHKLNIVFIFGQNNDLNCCYPLIVRFQPRFQTSFQVWLTGFHLIFAAHMQLGNIPPVYLFLSCLLHNIYVAIFKIKFILIWLYIFILPESVDWRYPQYQLIIRP